MAISLRGAILIACLASCSGAASASTGQIDEVHFSSRASFARDGYAVQFPIVDRDGARVFEISCYSLDDKAREKFALSNGTDPVSDLSCYVKDASRSNELTMLGVEEESLQFTPAFFWFDELKGCNSKSSYFLKASLRGIFLSFSFSHIDKDHKSADLLVSAGPRPSAKNDSLTDQSFRVGCT
jgi:hypothetical protein